MGKFDEFLKALEVGFALRKMATMATPVQDITEADGEWTIKTTTTFKTTTITFKLGEEFEEETADGRKAKATITLDGDTLTHSQKIPTSNNTTKDVTLLREFTDDGVLKMVEEVVFVMLC